MNDVTAGLFKRYLAHNHRAAHLAAPAKSHSFAYQYVAQIHPIPAFVSVISCLTLSCASFNHNAFHIALETSISLFKFLNHGRDSSSNLLASIHTFWSHSFVAESTRSHPFVNIHISQRTARALSISNAVGFGFVTNSRMAVTLSAFHALGIISSLVTFAKLGNTSISACCKSFTAGADS